MLAPFAPEGAPAPRVQGDSDSRAMWAHGHTAFWLSAQVLYLTAPEGRSRRRRHRVASKLRSQNIISRTWRRGNRRAEWRVTDAGDGRPVGTREHECTTDTASAAAARAPFPSAGIEIYRLVLRLVRIEHDGDAETSIHRRYSSSGWHHVPAALSWPLATPTIFQGPDI